MYFAKKGWKGWEERREEERRGMVNERRERLRIESSFNQVG